MDNDKAPKSGVVYILINDAMPGYIKIGITQTSVEQRVKELSRTSAVPIPFECYFAVRVADVRRVEAAIHNAFGDHRRNPKREFFQLAPERVVPILKLLAIEEVHISVDAGVENKADAQALELAHKRRAAFNFEMAQIPIESELKFIRNEEITCSVAPDQKHVIFNGETMSVSSAAQKALNSKWQVQGPAYWTYEGEILDERRIRIEAGIPTDKEIEEAGDYWMNLQDEIARGK
ncbi:MAG: GIY-YIG nuclease family protein [Candidatus Shapirobacteria bacterium]|nr:GIY-YIG nuclease family protein [Candidatus Shapirobacteria bacterium]